MRMMRIFNPVEEKFRYINLAVFAQIIKLTFGFFIAVGPAFADKTHNDVLEINSYDLHYYADLGGMKVEARHQMYPENGQYKVTTEAKNFLGKISEHGVFDISKNGTIIPRKYTKRQKTILGDRSESQQFDWATNKLLYSVNGKRGEMDILPGQFDSLSLKQQLRLDIALGKEVFAYTIIRKGKLKQYQYQVIGNEILSTSRGSYNSLLVQRLDKNPTKKTKIWLASDWNYVILKLETFEKNSKKAMVFNQGKLNGNSILPLKNKAEI